MQLPFRWNCEDKGTIPAASSAGAKLKENEEKPTRKTQREGKVERINDNDKRTGRWGIGKENDTIKTVAVTCDYSRPNCEREFTEFVTFKVTFEVFE
jgi:hypothetical protein